MQLSFAMLAPAIAAFLAPSPRAMPSNGAPEIAVRVPQQGLLRAGDRVQVVVEVQDPDGDALDVRAVEPPLGFAFAPRLAVATPARFTVDWRVEEIAAETGALTFTADDGSAETTVSVPFRLLTGTDPEGRIVLADVTGDGLEDVVAASRSGRYPTSDGPLGGAFVWEGGQGWPLSAPTISLHPTSTGQYPFTRLGGVHDVTGDGVADVVLSLPAAPAPIQVWRGGGDLATGAAPTFAADAVSGTTHLEGDLHFGDVTADGVDDILAGDGGSRIYVYAGGASIDAAPTAVLFVPVAPGDGYVGLGSDAIYLADVTGDGVLDVLASGERAAFGGPSSGAIYVWHGAAELRGPRSPSATLYAPWGPRGSLFQSSIGTSGFQVADATGDGIADVWDQGFDDVFLWRGGPDLVGRRTAELWLEDVAIPTSTQGLLDLDGDGRTDFLAGGRYAHAFWSDLGARIGSPEPDGSLVKPPALAGTPQSPVFHLADLDGDGLLDVLIGDPEADHPTSGEENAGAVQVWYAGATILPGTPPDATLLASDPTPQARLGRTVDVADVTGDGWPDVVASTRATGADTYVWAGGPARFSGRNDSSAALRGVGSVVRLLDVTGDGLADVVASDDALGGSSSGLLSIWRGGRTLVGEPAPILTASGAAGERFTEIAPRFADLDGDDVLDLFTGSTQADVESALAAGSIRVWRGGATFGPPAARIERAVPVTDDLLGRVLPSALRDLTGDGLVDLVFGGELIDVLGTVDTGAILLLPSGGLPPALELFVPGASQGARLGDE